MEKLITTDDVKKAARSGWQKKALKASSGRDNSSVNHTN